MVDTGVADQVQLYSANLRRAGREPADLIAILHTHNHRDHSGGTAKLVEVSGAETMIGEADAPALAALAPVGRGLKDGDDIVFGGTRLMFIHTPGHTRGCGMYLMPHDGTRVCFVGDAAGPYIFEHVRWEGDAEAFRKSAARMKGVVADLYLPGHPHQTLEVSSEGDPRLTQEQWHRYVDDRVRTMERTISGPGA
jgi:metallo-beta-lactamase class B